MSTGLIPVSAVVQAVPICWVVTIYKVLDKILGHAHVAHFLESTIGSSPKAFSDFDQSDQHGFIFIILRLFYFLQASQDGFACFVIAVII